MKTYIGTAHTAAELEAIIYDPVEFWTQPRLVDDIHTRLLKIHEDLLACGVILRGLEEKYHD